MAIPTQIRVEWGDLTIHDCSDDSNPYGIVEFDGGSPVTNYEAIASLMTDGSYQSSPGHGNRENLAFGIRITFADTQEAVDLAEALELEAGKPFNELRFYQGDDVGPVTVLETFPAGASAEPWEVFAERGGRRIYRFTVPALPFARALLPQTINWTDIGTKLDTLAATTGWSSSGSAPTPSTSGGRNFFSVAAGTTLTKTFTIDRDFLWVWSQKDSGGSANGQRSGLSAVSIGGTAVSSTLWSPDISAQPGAINGNDVGAQRSIDVSAWNGQTVTVALTFTGGAPKLWGLWTLDYPSVTQTLSGTTMTRPIGVGVIDVKGSARTPCAISFTAPSGGAFVYTGPDPARAVREYGAGEVVFAHFTVASGGTEISINSWVTWFPAGTHTAMIGFTEPQPIEINPNGVWPQGASGSQYGSQYAYPQDRRAAVSFYETSGAKNLVSPSPRTPQGYIGDAVHHEPHALHPDRSGFAVLDTSGNPIAATITYYPRNWIHAAH